MAISFQKLLDLLAAREISIYRLKTDKVIGTATIDKLRTNTGNIDTRSINSICEYLQVQPGGELPLPVWLLSFRTPLLYHDFS